MKKNKRKKCKFELRLNDDDAVVVRGAVKGEFNASGVVVYQINIQVYPAAGNGAPQLATAPAASAPRRVGDKRRDGIEGSTLADLCLEQNCQWRPFL